jgi:N-acetylglucosamine kinase-like BadF-type ATPase
MFDDNPEAIKSSTAEIKLIWRPADHPNHPNIARLYKRMDRAYEDQDYAAVLHASASIFETVVKLKFRNQNVETQTLGGLFDGYRRRSELPAQILDFIRETYKRRNTEPLSGHGATRPPSINRNEAKALKEFTKVIVRLEYP